MREISRLTAPGGQVVIVDIGLPQNHDRLGTFFARLWERMGDCLYDYPTIMQNAGLDPVTFEEYGPGNHIRVIVGQKRTR